MKASGPNRARVEKGKSVKATPQWVARLEAAKQLKVQTCSSCKKDRPAAEFSKKMKKRKLDAWRCTACVAAVAASEHASKRPRQDSASVVSAAEWAARAAAIKGPPKNKKERRIVEMAAKYAPGGANVKADAAVQPTHGTKPAPVIGKAAALLDPARLAELLAGAAPKNRGERRALAEQQNGGPPAAATLGTVAAPAPATAAARALTAAPPAAATVAAIVSDTSGRTVAAAQPVALSLDAWLADIGLSSYIESIKSYGYVQLSMLLDASEEDILEMTQDPDMNMKKPARKTMVVQWRALKQ